MCPRNRQLLIHRAPARPWLRPGNTRLPMFRRKRICEALLAALLVLEGQRAFALTYRCSSDIVTTASSNSTSIGTIVGIFYNNQTCASIPMGLGSLVLDNTGHSEEIPSTSTALYFENQGSGSYSYLSMTGGAPELNMNGNSIAYGSDNTTGASSYTGDTVVELDSTWNVGTVSNTIIQAGVLLEPTSSVNLGGSVVLGDPANEIVITSEIAPTLEFGFGLSSYSGPIYVADNYGEIDGLPGGVYTLSGNIEPTSSGQTGVEFSNTQGYGAVFDLYGLVTNQLPVIIDAGVTLVPEGGNNLLLPSAVSVYGTLSVPAGINTGVTTLEGNGGVTVGSAGSVVIENGSTTFSGIIGGAGGLQVVQGTQTLSGANTYTGDTTIDAYSGLDLTGTGSLADSRVNTPGGLFISGVTNGTSIRSLTGSSAGIVVLGSQTLTLTNAADTFPGVISGTGGLTVAASTESLTNANTYTGATTIAAGATLQLGSGGSIANSPVTANGNFDISPTPAGATIPSLAGASGGVVNLGGQTLTLSSPVDTFNGVLQGTNGALAVLAGTETLTGASTYTGVTTIYAGAGIDLSGNGSLANSLVVTPGGLFIGGSTNGATVGSLSGTSQGIVVLGSKTLTLDQAGATFAGVISGVGGGLDISAGTEMLTGVNTYTGATTVASGATLDLSGSGSVSSSAVTANGVVDISATSAGTSFQSLAGGGSGVVNLGTQNLSLSNAVDTFNGSITSTGGSLSVTGGTETLAGNNGYTGTTTISGGATLALSGTGSIASSSSVNDSGTLDISGVFSRATIVSLSGPTTGVVNLGGSNLALSQASGSFGGS